MTDVQHFQTNDGGEIRFANGIVLDDGVASAVYESLFGGNLDDDGTAATLAREWWGNKIEGDPARQVRGRTEAVLTSMPATTANLREVEDAAAADLEWMTDTGLASVVVARASLPARNAVKIEIKAEIDGNIIPFDFVRPWGV